MANSVAPARVETLWVLRKTGRGPVRYAPWPISGRTNTVRGRTAGNRFAGALCVPDIRSWACESQDRRVVRVLYRLLAGLAALAVRSGRARDLEIVVLRHQVAVLRRQVGRRRSPRLTDRCWPTLAGRCRDGDVKAGSSPPTPCFVGIAAGSPATGPNPQPPAVQVGHRHRRRSASWSCEWPPRTPRGGTDASKASCVASGTALSCASSMGPPERQWHGTTSWGCQRR